MRWRHPTASDSFRRPSVPFFRLLSKNNVRSPSDFFPCLSQYSCKRTKATPAKKVSKVFFRDEQTETKSGINVPIATRAAQYQFRWEFCGKQTSTKHNFLSTENKLIFDGFSKSISWTSRHFLKVSKASPKPRPCWADEVLSNKFFRPTVIFPGGAVHYTVCQ